ncbi:MAG: 3-phosphoshikimate 1-carboxyvinyltransferase [Lachnospiraceae bacterium]|nr:3-phosphoshikimate 1-carboxyvinyltransferase [Lachnospiraceae bacterium]
MDFNRVNGLRGEVEVPGDKSISHRSVMFGSIAKGITEIDNFLMGADCLSTIACFRKMGVDIDIKDNGSVIVKGNGLHGLKEPGGMLDTGNSGTTTRLISGILAGQSFTTTLNGDESIQKRPMKRIITPLSMMNANITSIKGNDCAPLKIEPAKLKGISYNSPVASAQVKSAILLAGLYAEGETKVIEPELSRNHTELMLKGFGANVSSVDKTATIYPASELNSQHITVPGDISSAVYFVVAGLITPNSEITIKNVGLNPTRDGIIEVVKNMGGSIEISNEHSTGGEKVGDITVKTSNLKGTTIGGSVIPRLIDELPTMALLACYADGDTNIKDAAELKVKESDRISVMVENLSKMGANVEGTEDGMIIHGPCPLKGATIDPKKDHRIAMTFAIASANASGTTTIIDADCVNISYPTFYEDYKKLMV